MDIFANILIGFFMYGGLMLIIGGISVMVTSKLWRESPRPIQDYQGWKKARAEREYADSNNFEHYKELCEEERKYAKWTLHSFFWLATVVLAPVSVVVYVLFAALYFPIKWVKVLWSLPKIIQSAKGI